MANHKINIEVALNGQQQAVSGIQAVINKAREAGNVRVNQIFDTQGKLTGAQISQSFKKIGEEAAKAKPHTNDLVNALRRAAIVAPIWMIMRNVMMTVFNTFTDQIKFLVEFETAMTRIKIVGKGTAEEYKTLASALVNLGQAYGVSSSEAAQAAVLFAQQGKTVKEVITLTATAMLASKILGTDIKTAVDDMTAAIEGFGIGANESTKIVDKWINVEKQFAVTSKDLADATKAAGASANALGITIDQFLGDVTAVVEVTRKSGAEAARGLSFIYARMYTSGKQTVEQIAKVPYYLDATGNATDVVSTKLRSSAAILEDIAGKWNSLNKQEKLSIATSLGSKRQMVVLNALMQNYNTSLDARIASLTSAGSAEKAFILTLDTTATKVQQLSATWNILTAAVADTSAFKGAIDMLKQIILGWTVLINKKAGMKAILTQENVAAVMSNQTLLNQVKVYQELLDVRAKLKSATQTPENVSRLKTIEDALGEINTKQPSLKIAYDTGKPEVLQKEIQSKIDKLEEIKVRLSLRPEYLTQKMETEDYIAKAKEGIAISTGKAKVEWTKRLAEEEQKLVDITAKEEAEIQSTLKINKGLEASKKNIITDTEAELVEESELTNQEIERLNIAQQLNLAKEAGLLTDTELLNLEIELVKNSKYQSDIHKNALKEKELESKMASAILKDSEDLISHELELLKIRGANESQLLDIQYALEMQLHGEDAVKNSLQYRLDMEKKLTKEKMNQVDISSDSVTLYKLALKYGADAAKEVGALLSGKLTFRGFQNTSMQTSQKAFEEFFSNKADMFNAASYFGLPGGVGGYAEGGNIPIPEKDVGRVRSIEEMREKYGIQTSTTSRPVSIQSLEVNVNTSIDGKKTTDEQAKQLQIDIAEAIKNDPKVKQAIDERIGEF